jgi:hypothetical protein
LNTSNVKWFSYAFAVGFMYFLVVIEATKKTLSFVHIQAFLVSQLSKSLIMGLAFDSISWNNTARKGQQWN